MKNTKQPKHRSKEMYEARKNEKPNRPTATELNKKEMPWVILMILVGLFILLAFPKFTGYLEYFFWLCFAIISFVLSIVYMVKTRNKKKDVFVYIVLLMSTIGVIWCSLDIPYLTKPKEEKLYHCEIVFTRALGKQRPKYELVGTTKDGEKITFNFKYSKNLNFDTMIIEYLPFTRIIIDYNYL